MSLIPHQITFRDIRTSAAVRAKITERIEKLDQFHPRISSCRVVVRAPHRHQHKGRLYNIRIDVKVPRREIAINHEPAAHQAHQDIYVAIHDAFNALERRLEDIVRRRRGDIKAHPEKSDIRMTATTVRPAKRAAATR